MIAATLQGIYLASFPVQQDFISSTESLVGIFSRKYNTFEPHLNKYNIHDTLLQIPTCL